jgi:5-(carboxyamino)imidazole ribonucleotide synthase
MNLKMFRVIRRPFLKTFCAGSKFAALKTAQDRVDEKTFIVSLGIPVAPFAAVNGEAELEEAIARIGRPSVLKTRRFGYDGKGQAKIVEETSAAAAWAEIGKAPAILEGFISFNKEISVIARG